MICAEIETRELQALSAQPVYPDTGMYMTGEDIASRAPPCFPRWAGISRCDIMHEQKITYLPFLGVYENARLRIPILVQDIMITFYQTEMETGKIIPPF